MTFPRYDHYFRTDAWYSNNLGMLRSANFNPPGDHRMLRYRLQHLPGVRLALPSFWGFFQFISLQAWTLKTSPVCDFPVIEPLGALSTISVDNSVNNKLKFI